GYNIDQNTATAYFTPTTLGKYVLACRTADYDPITNIEYSYINRDVQVSIILCEATSKPLIDSIPQHLSIGSKYIPGKGIEVCPRTTISFEINTSTNLTTNTLYLFSNNNVVIPGSNFSVNGNGTSAPTGTLTWTPNITDVGGHTLIFEVIDSTCTGSSHILEKNVSVVYIEVLPGVDAG